jgi:hypothetical protein
MSFREAAFLHGGPKSVATTGAPPRGIELRCSALPTGEPVSVPADKPDRKEKTGARRRRLRSPQQRGARRSLQIFLINLSAA